MYRRFILFIFVILFSAATATAQDATPIRQPGVVKDNPMEANAGRPPDSSKEIQTDANKGSPSDAKEMSGMSIVGNEDAPKSLYIVPWKSSDIGAETGLDMMLNEGDVPVDRDVFKREIEFFQVSTGK
jgi:hypothetical protein